MPVQGQFRRQIGTESYYKISLQVYQREILSGLQVYWYKTCRFVFAGILVRCLVGLGLYTYWHEAYCDNVFSRDLERQ